MALSPKVVTPNNQPMGFFQKLTGGTDANLLQTGIPGRGVILAVQPGGTTLQIANGLTERACTFTVEVTLDNTPAYQASCKQRVQEVYIPQFVPGATVVAVRADPQDLSRIALDFNNPPPTVTVASQPGQESAADILATGIPARAVIVQTQPLGMQNAAGVDMHAFVLTVIPTGSQPYQIQVGNPTPPEALPFLFPGSNVPVKVSAQNAQSVVVDWQAALNPPSP